MPYWRFKGCLFSSTPKGIRHRIVDVSSMALNSKDFPISLGLRTQALRLKFFSPEVKGRCLRATTPFKNVLASAGKRFSLNLPKPLFLNSFIGETISMIYAPFYLSGGYVIDAVLNRKTSGFGCRDTHLEGLQDIDPGWRIRFIPALCPACGWDIEGHRNSLAFACSNCNSMWIQSRDRFSPLEFASIPAGHKDAVYLPFYRIYSEVSGLDLESSADLIKIANLPRVVRDSCKERKFYFWTPAFKIRPGELLGFSTRLTLSQPKEQWHETLPPAGSHPVTLPVSEAAGLTRIVLADFIRPVSLLKNIQQIQIRPKHYLLVYLPFQARGRELYQHQFNLRLNKNVLDYAGHL